MTSPPPEISVIIVNLNTCGLLDACLASVMLEGETLPIEVIVIDNGSTDESVRMVREKYPSATLLLNTRNEGFARPNNAGMRAARGNAFLLLNSDTVVKQGAFRALKETLESHPEAGACGPRLVYPDGRLQHSVKGFPTLFTHLCDMLFLDTLFPRSRTFGRGEMRYFDYTRAAEVDHLMAAAFLVRREAWAKVGDLDERFAIYYNDMDWCFRMRAAGWSIRYTPDAEVEHHLGRTVGSVNRDFRYFDMLHNNVLLFYQKHYSRASVVLYKLLLACGFVPRLVAWSVVSLLRPSTHARHMRRFSAKTLVFGLTFWQPVQVKEL